MKFINNIKRKIEIRKITKECHKADNLANPDYAAKYEHRKDVEAKLFAIAMYVLAAAAVAAYVMLILGLCGVGPGPLAAFVAAKNAAAVEAMAPAVAALAAL